MSKVLFVTFIAAKTSMKNQVGFERNAFLSIKLRSIKSTYFRQNQVRIERETVQAMDTTAKIPSNRNHLKMFKLSCLAVISAFLYILLIFKAIAMFSQGKSSPFFPFDLFSKCYVAEDKCPNDNVTFWLYTRSTQDNPTQLNVANEQTITSANYAQGRPFIVLIHGYTGHKDYSPNSHIRPALFQNGEYNVISVDYNPLALEPCYVQAVHNLPVVARCTAQLLDNMMGNGLFTLDDLHIIGFSLGGQTAGMISNFVKTGKLRRITALDPAKPMFVFANADHRVGPDDADFVQVVHTDSFARGVLAASGHQDFYMNGGIEQPGCNGQQNQSVGSCNHDRAPIYFAESINSETGFWGFKCKEWKDWALGLCRNSDEQAIMGWKATNESQGIFMVYTNSEPPYAKGKQEPLVKT